MSWMVAGRVSCGLVLAACGDSSESGSSSQPDSCPSCDAPRVIATIASPDILEASGIVASATHPGIYYVHNDSGDEARFFAVDETGADRGTFHLQGVTAVDFEDVGAGPCADAEGSCLYIGDIGDNDGSRSTSVFYRIVEPDTLGPGVHTVAAEAFPFRFPDGPHDSEALFVVPGVGTVVIVTKDKEEAVAYAYEPPLQPGSVVELGRWGAVATRGDDARITGASIRSDGTALLLRSPRAVWLYPIEGQVADALAREPCSAKAPDEKQGEAIAWATDGARYVTVGEGAHAALSAVGCR